MTDRTQPKGIMQYVRDLEYANNELLAKVRQREWPQVRLNWVLFGLGVLVGVGVSVLVRMI